MKRFIMKEKRVPQTRLKNTLELQRYIKTNLNIDIDLATTYELWIDISESWSAGWLYSDTHYEGMTREEFLLSEMEKRGHIIYVEL